MEEQEIPKRPQSAYQKHMSDSLKQKKADSVKTGNAYNHKDSFKACAEEWKMKKIPKDDVVPKVQKVKKVKAPVCKKCE